jgi:hypothetical protein
MPNATIQSTTVCSGGEHRRFVTDLGSVEFLTTELAADPRTLAELKEAFRIVIRHEYWKLRAAGRTQAQALTGTWPNGLIGLVVRL